MVPELNRRAADWFESIGLLEEAMSTRMPAGPPARPTCSSVSSCWRTAAAGSARSRPGSMTPQAAATTRARDRVALDIRADGRSHRGGPLARHSELSRSSGTTLLGTASFRSSMAFVRAMMTRSGPDAMLRDAEFAVREEPETSPYRSAALGFVGLATCFAVTSSERTPSSRSPQRPAIGWAPTVGLRRDRRASLIAAARAIVNRPISSPHSASIVPGDRTSPASRPVHRRRPRSLRAGDRPC